MSITDLLLIFTAKLLSPFSLQEGEVGITENEFCNALYGQRPGQNKDYVHEEMLCAGGLSTGKSICRVSKAVVYFPHVYSISVSPGVAVLSSSLCGDTHTSCFITSTCFPWVHASIVSLRIALANPNINFLLHILNFLLKHNTYTNI